MIIIMIMIIIIIIYEALYFIELLKYSCWYNVL